MAQPFTLLLRVRYGECDAQQVVFNARYGDYIDVAATEFYRVLFGSYQALLERGLDSQVVRMNTDWSSSARFDDVLELRVQTLRLGTTSYSLQVDILQHAEQRLVARSEITYVMIDARSFTKVAIPDDLRARFEQGAPGVLINQAG
ncbi:4-hydroxybenzoyl-CoA thioesterase [Pseudomonas alcaligenes]|uniref:4-hydroxybenzoyl-CoA thioesterase n=1 Tax=Aquipseudomonas alcaligenes TaxID=43263 RepID=A0ABR7S4F4_AQUAC|nr:thioesterase family protein [Pseudomonas alcaligenes]MBC9252353.1 4-hydroxybenzoyl-CoA thioesterase [Pseudomonas alcaligenes]